MAIFSKEEMFCDDQAITGTAASENVIDFGTPGTWTHSSIAIKDDKGNSCIPLAVQVTEDFDNLTSLNIALQKDDNAAFGSATEIFNVDVVLASLVAGYKMPVYMIPWTSDEPYLRLNFTVTGTAPTAGKITAGIACLDQPWGNR